jgi:UPF0042 nucleotide-binding protein|tara:strand:- start:500 stop:1339 length:840 start_codon:yes stop_codon:yes gene_type:complete
MKLYIVSGRSGAGKTIALNTFEDLGYYCVDNLPLSLLSTLVQEIRRERPTVAVSIDARNNHNVLKEFRRSLDELRANSVDAKIVFLDADDDELVKRYSETRRQHPLGMQGLSLPEAIHREGELLLDIAENADICIDTTQLSLYDLRDVIRENLMLDKPKVILQLKSFGFKHGPAKDADLLFDVRCLPNPYWKQELRGYSGKDQPVQNFFAESNKTEQMIEHICQFLKTWLPEYIQSNRAYLTVGIGCTGGKHRSVFVTDQVAERLKDEQVIMRVKHREL